MNIFREKYDEIVEYFGFKEVSPLKTDLSTTREGKEIDPHLINPEDPDSPVYDKNSYSFGLDIEDSYRNINELVYLYRSAAQQPEVDDAIDEIVNEAIIMTEGDVVTLNIDRLEVPKSIKNKIHDEFKTIVNLLKFNTTADVVFRQWYVDGRLIVQKIVDAKNTKKGLIGLKVLSPTTIARAKDRDTGEYFYIYREDDLKKNGLKIPEDRICYVPSGITEPKRKYYISYIHRALKALNQLRLLEDSAVIYRITRAPERRVFYIDTGKMPKTKAEQYVTKIMNKFRNKVTYDVNTGQMTQKKNTLTMLEDFYLPTSSDSKGTKVETLPGGQQLSEIEDIKMFKRNLLRALKVPTNRMDDENNPTVDFGRVGEITRTELKFAKFTKRLRDKFSEVFLDLLKTQLILKGIISLQDWETLSQDIDFNWATDSYWEEMKDIELLTKRVEVIQSIGEHVGKYFSKSYVDKKILRMTDEDIETRKKEIDEEKAAGEHDSDDE